MGAQASNSQKEIERRHLHSFHHLCEDFPAGDLIEGEIPDFVIITPTGKKIGIEHTQVFKKSGADETAEQPDEATKDFITTAAKRHAELLELPPAHVALFFNPQYLRRVTGAKRRFLTKAEKQSIAESIAVFVGRHMPAQECSVECDWRPGQPRQVDLIQINRIYPVDRHIWRWPEFNTIQYNATERFQDAITKTSTMYAPCLCECDECWLLVVADSFQSSGNIHPDATSLSDVYTSPFSRIYF
jgi:hypothetical protein